MNTVFLGAIALATVVMAAMQVGAVVYAGRLARRVERLADQVEREMKPLSVSLATITRDAARATSLAVTQMERADRLFADAAERVEQTLTIVQNAVMAPAREGFALISGFKAALAVLRGLRDRARRGQGRADDEDALFIG